MKNRKLIENYRGYNIYRIANNIAIYDSNAYFVLTTAVADENKIHHIIDKEIKKSKEKEPPKISMQSLDKKLTGYDFLFIAEEPYKPMDGYSVMVEALRQVAKQNHKYVILIDNLLNTGNNRRRFVRGIYEQQKIIFPPVRHVPIEHDSVIRQLTSENIRTNHLIDSQMLTPEEQKVILGGDNL